MVNDERPDRSDGVAMDVVESAIGPIESKSPQFDSTPLTVTDIEMDTTLKTMTPASTEMTVADTETSSANIETKSIETESIAVDTNISATNTEETTPANKDTRADTVESTVDTRSFVTGNVTAGNVTAASDTDISLAGTNTTMAVTDCQMDSSNPSTTASDSTIVAIDTAIDVDSSDSERAALLVKSSIDAVNKSHTNAEIIATDNVKNPTDTAMAVDDTEKIMDFSDVVAPIDTGKEPNPESVPADTEICAENAESTTSDDTMLPVPIETVVERADIIDIALSSDDTMQATADTAIPAIHFETSSTATDITASIEQSNDLQNVLFGDDSMPSITTDNSNENSMDRDPSMFEPVVELRVSDEDSLDSTKACNNETEDDSNRDGFEALEQIQNKTDELDKISAPDLPSLVENQIDESANQIAPAGNEADECTVPTPSLSSPTIPTSADDKSAMEQEHNESVEDSTILKTKNGGSDGAETSSSPQCMDVSNSEPKGDDETQATDDADASIDNSDDLLVPTDFVPDRDLDHTAEDAKRKFVIDGDSDSEYGQHKKLRLADVRGEFSSFSDEDSDVDDYKMHVDNVIAGLDSETMKMDTSDAPNATAMNPLPLFSLGSSDVLTGDSKPAGETTADSQSGGDSMDALSADQTPADNNIRTELVDGNASTELKSSDIKLTESLFSFAQPNELPKIADGTSECITPAEPITFADIIANTDYYMEPGKLQPNGMEAGTSAASKHEEKFAPHNSAITGDLANFDMTTKLKDFGDMELPSLPKLERKSSVDGEQPTDEATSEQSSSKKGQSNDANDDRRSKATNMRKNIRDVMDDIQLDASTLAAQRQESERMARVQEQQRLIREMQRQSALERQQLRAQNKVMSMLQGNASLLKVSKSSDASLSKILGTDHGDDGAMPSTSKSGNQIVKFVGKKETSSDMDPFDISGLSASDKSDDLFVIDGMGSDEEEDDCIELVQKKDVVEIDDSSDDDCILLSDDEDDLGDDDDDDPQNSGLHVNDMFNKPDDQGRVIVNIGHPENEEDIFLAPQIARIIKPHQIGGVRFLYENIIESTERFSTSEGFGCILAHSMGLGKTLQLVCFCDIFLRHTNSKSVLCIMPINTLQNWMAEFNMWLPSDPETSPLREQGEVRPRNFNLFVLNDTHKTVVARSKVVLEWARNGGVLLIGYELYRLLCLKKVTRRRGRKNARDPELEEREAEEHKKTLDDMHAALVNPGPDLVVCDEGHRIKNSHASTSISLKQIRTKRRVVLTGYPLQNNLLEYWCMVDFVRPNYLGTKTEFSNMFERPIQNGQCIDSTPQDMKLMRYRAHVLHSLLIGFVQRRSHLVLNNSLPLKQEFVILVRMTAFQRKLYSTFMEIVRKKAVPNPLKAFAVCCKIWNHPDVLYNFLKKREADLELEEADNAQAEAAIDSAPNANKGVKKRVRKGAKLTEIKEEKRQMTDINNPAASTSASTMSASNTVGDTNDTKKDILKVEKNEFTKSEQSAFDSLSKPLDKSINTPQQQHQQQQQPPSYMNAFQSNPSQYNQSMYPPSQYPSGYPYHPGLHGFNSPYNSYNQYDTNGYYNNFGQPNPYNNPLSNRYYWNQGQQSAQPNQPNQSGFNFTAPTTDPAASQQSSEFNSMQQWPQQQYGGAAFGSYPSGGFR